MFKVNNKATKMKPRRRFGSFIVNFEHISHLCSSVSTVNFEHVIVGWDSYSHLIIIVQQIQTIFSLW